MKKCTRCKLEKPLVQYYMHAKSKDRLSYQCKACVALGRRESRARDTSKGTEDGYRRRVLLAKYGITPACYATMLTSQGNVCAICKQGQTVKRLAVDHCHRTGRVRGLLCDPCNKGIGMLKDDVTLLAAAMKYLSS